MMRPAPSDLLEELPESVLAALHEGERGDDGSPPLSEVQLGTLTKIITGEREKNKTYRQTSGIEHIWQRFEEAYIGMDDGNRGEFSNQRFQVPLTTNAGLTKDVPKGDGRCTLYVRLTARYVDMGAAKAQEFLIGPDEKTYKYEPTPVPDLIADLENHTPVMLAPGQPAMRDARPDELGAHPTPLPQPTDPNAPPPMKPGVPILQKDLAQETMEMARKKAEKAEKRVDDWKAEANFTKSIRRVLFDAARLGVGVLKGPFPCIRKAMAITKTPVLDEMNNPVVVDGKPKTTTTLAFEEKLCPDWAAVSPWDLFPSSSCGENVRNGEWLFHRDRLSRRQVEDLGELPGYITSSITQVLEEGPNKGQKDTGNRNPSVADDDTRFEVWYGYGSLKREEWEAIQDAGDYATPEDRPKTLPASQKSVYAIVTLINDCIMYASINPLTSGTIPFWTFPWQQRPGSWAGIGIGEQVDVPQRAIVAAFRAMIDNAGVSAGAQIVIDKNAITAQDGDNTIARNKIWLKGPDCEDVRGAFAIFQIPNITAQMITIIDKNYRIAEESCNIPLISQGQSGADMPQTLGGQQLQNSNANQLLRGIASTYDDEMNEPENKATYEWLLLDPNVPEDEKGDFQINARGSSALAERAIQDQAAVEVLQLVAKEGQVLGLDPKRAAVEYLKSKRLDPEKYQFTPEELEQKANQPPPKPPQLQVAEVRAQVDMQKIQKDTDRDTAFVQAENQRAQIEHDARMQELGVKRELELLKYANEQKITLMEVKAQLESNALKLKTQKELSVLSAEVDLRRHHTPKAVAPESVMHPQATTPPTEPVGKAPDGEAWQK